MGKKLKKTNAMRLLDGADIPYRVLSYTVDEDHLDGMYASEQLGLPPQQIFKTLVTHSGEDIVVALLPVDGTLDLKALAQAAGIKKLEMLPLKEVRSVTGYQRGGCSPLAMRREYPTFVHLSALEQPEIVVNAGARGWQIAIAPQALVDFGGMTLGDFVQD